MPSNTDIDRKVPQPRGQRWLQRLVAVLAIAAPTLYLASLFPAELMWLDTTAAGGDLGSHNYAATWVRTLMLTEYRLTGWVPGNYAGFPLFQMYFPLPFVAIVFGSLVVGANVAFKLTTVAGIVGLPAAAFLLLRRLQAPSPAPAVGASLMLLFLLQDGNTMWGGNVASTLAGEFTYSISLVLALMWFGVHNAAMTHTRGAALGAVVIALLSLTHAYTVLWVALAAALAVLMRPHAHAALLRYVVVFIWGGALCAFWLVPLVWYAPWTTAFRHLWVISSITELLPRPLWPVVVAVVLCPVIIWWRGRDAWQAYTRQVLLLHAGALAAALAYAAAPNFGIVDIRFLPFLQVMLCLLAAVGAGHVLARWPARVLWIPIAFFGAVLLVQGETARMSAWARWNFEGFERKPLWPVYRDISNHLRGDFTQPRVAYEHSPDHEVLGTIRAFENLPLFSGRSTLEGVNMQASVTSPFVFYVQSEISEVMSCPFSEWGCSRPDLSRGIDRLRMMHVSDLIVRSDTMKAAAAAEPQLELEASFGAYEIYRLTDSAGGYVLPLTTAPFVVATSTWKVDAYRWFKTARVSDPIPIFVRDVDDAAELQATAVFAGLPAPGAVQPMAAGDEVALHEEIEAERVVVTGVQPGQPLLIRMSYHPRWRSSTGERVWLAGPGFMLVVPESERLELVYGSSAVTTAAVVISGVAWLAVVIVAIGVPRRLFGPRQVRLAPVMWTGVYRRGLLGVCVAAGLVLVAAGLHARRDDADSVYRGGQQLLDAGQTQAAIEAFQRARAMAPLSNTAIHATYFEAIALYRAERWAEAAVVFRHLADTYPEAHAAAEAVYHVGLCAQRTGDRPRARGMFEETQRRFPGSYWAGVAGDRLVELDTP